MVSIKKLITANFTVLYELVEHCTYKFVLQFSQGVENNILIYCNNLIKSLRKTAKNKFTPRTIIYDLS